mmetsp:Transcript_11773/g.49599  ORF Transcript_11773/g.49599 Transcript_11773/m.49599 type:complete len:256 (-) Transcript_11773:517-1284(-)
MSVTGPPTPAPGPAAAPTPGSSGTRPCTISPPPTPPALPPASASPGGSSSLSSPSPPSLPRRLSRMAAYFASFASYSGSALNTSSSTIASSSSSSPTSCVIWSSASTRSSSSGTAGKSAKRVLRTANRPSMTNCTRRSIWPSCNTFLSRSNIECSPCGDSECRHAPHSLVNATAISTDTSVGFSSSNMRSWSARISWATWWFTKWATNLASARQACLSFRRYARRNCRTTRPKRSSPISGNLVLITAMSAANVGV